ncbi:MAG: hypothetical protein R3A78_02315 [Polyangiales bacterium]
MSTLHLGTRKGLFTLERRGAVYSIAHVDFLGDPVSMLVHDPSTGALYAGLDLVHFGAKLRRRDRGASEWTECASPEFPKDDEAKAMKTFWALEPDGRGGLWAGTIPGGLFHSKDRGATWVLNRALWDHPDRKKWMGGGADEPGIHSVCVHPQNPDDVLIAVSCGGAWRTLDGGKTWASAADGMYAEFMPPERRNEPAIQDPHRVSQCSADPNVLWCQHHNGMFRSTNRGGHWEELVGVGPSKFGFGVVAHPTDPKTAWFVPGVKDACRVPVDAKLVVTRTRDGGKTGEVLTKGLPQSHAYDIVYRHALDLTADGRTLAFGSTTGNAFVSADGGDSWSRVDAQLPPVYCVRFSG